MRGVPQRWLRGLPIGSGGLGSCKDGFAGFARLSEWGAEIVSRYDPRPLIGDRSSEPRYSISVSLALQVAWVTQP